MLLTGLERAQAEALILARHYTHSVSSGKSHVTRHADVIIIWSLPANPYIGRFLRVDGPVWELSRMWAPDGHEPNALTRAIASSVAELRNVEPVAALISYADPNVGHTGGVYRAASWVYLGQCEESRYYRGPDGQVVARRRFHSGRKGLKKAEILARGYEELRLPGKHRFARGLTRQARKVIAAREVPFGAGARGDRAAA